MNIAIFGDLHGRILLPFFLGRRWEEETGETIDLALSVGDLGIYRSFYNMEKTSRRWAKRHPEELGFSKFFFSFDVHSGLIRRHPVADELLEAVDFDLYFVPGNHEEHEYLKEVEERYATSAQEPIAVDRDWRGEERGQYKEGQFWGYGRIHLLPQGPLVSLPPHHFLQEERPPLLLQAINGLAKYTPPPAWQRHSSPIDILLSHETFLGRLDEDDPSHRRNPRGSERLRDLILNNSPAFHFFGHHHRYHPQKELPSYRGTPIHSTGLHQVVFGEHNGLLPWGCFGILRLDGPGEGHFAPVEESWLHRFPLPTCRAFL